MTNSDDERLIFDLGEALRRKRKGIAQVSENNPEFLGEARWVAAHLLKRSATITMDDVRKVCEKLAIEPAHHNAWGGVFTHAFFTWTGEMVPSIMAQRHRNMIRVWRRSADAPTPVDERDSFSPADYRAATEGT